VCAGDEGRVYALGKGGTFALAAGAPVATALASAGAYAVLVAGDGTGLRYFLSPDGVAWREITPAR
jgi:hypothetical protein